VRASSTTSRYQERLVGCYDERGYRCYRDTPDFARHEAHKHRKWWAHAGGLADFNFLLEFLISEGAPATIISRGSAAIVIDALGTSWHDSYFLLRAPLADLGAKGDVDFETSTDEELAEYNKQDNVILYEALHNFCNVVESLGGQMRATVAATAMDLFRRAYQTRPAYSTTESNETARLAYFGSDVQVRGEYGENVHIYDINSSFPASMALGGCPWQYLGKTRRKVGTRRAGIAYCEIETPASMAHPYLPVRAPNGGVYFPTGSWAGWYTEADLDYASELGIRIRPLVWLLYERSDDLRGYARDLYERRRKSTGFWRLVLKFLLNALYGKFGESTAKEQIVLSGPRPSEDARPVYPGAWTVSKEQYLAHEQPHICAWITSLSRQALHRMLMRVVEAGYLVYYNDTDSLMTNAPTLPGGLSDALGAFDRVDEMLPKARFMASKLYTGVSEAGHRFVKAKGFAPASQAMRNYKRAIKSGTGLADALREIDDVWGSIESGTPVEYAAPNRFRAVLRGKGPGERDTQKTRLQKRLPKRRAVSKSETKPWSYIEIMERALH